MLIISDRIKESSVSEGSGAIALGLPFGSFQSFSEGVGNGNATYYCVENGVRWEVGKGTYTSAGNLLSRDTVLDSSASGAKINLEGASTVFCTLPAGKAIFENESGHTYVAGISTLELNVSGVSSESINNSGQATFGEDVVVSGDLALLGQFLFDGDLANINRVTTSGEIVSSGLLTLVKPNGNAGNFLHAYKDDGTEQTLALHVDNNISPLWKFGLKTNPDNETDPPTFAYVFARDGSIGLVSNADNYCSISDDIGFTVQNVANNVLRVSSLTGVYIETSSSANPSLVVTGPVLNAEDLTRWSQSDDTVLSVVDSGGKIGILTDTPTYELDVNGSGRMDTLKTSGVYFEDGTFQSTAAISPSGSSAAVSGWADTTMTNRDNSVSGWAGTTISNGDSAVSGYFQTYVDSQDHSAVQVSGWADATFNLQEVTNRGNITTNDIFTSGDFTATSGNVSGVKFTPLADSSHPAHAEGIVFYDSDSHALTVYNEEADVSLQLGQEEYLRVRNNNSYAIPNGSGVYINGSQGTHPTIDFAIASGSRTSHVVGLATHTIESNSFGYVSTYGEVRGLDTSAFLDGDEVYLSATNSGVYTTTPPVAPNYEVAIGHVIRSHASNGKILSRSSQPKLGGSDIKSLGGLNTSGIAFFSQITNEDAGILTTDANFFYDSGNDRVHIGSGGIRFDDGSTQATATDINTVTNTTIVKAMITDSISTLTGSGVVYDGVLLVSGDVACVANPTDQVDVGIYTIESGAWTRHTSHPSGDTVGSYVFQVASGTAYSDTYWQTINHSGVTYGSSGIDFFQLSPQSNGVLEATDEATVVFDAWKTHDWEVTLEGNRTLSVINEEKVNVIRVKLTQDGVGSRTVTWWSGISWVGGTVPTLTATASKSDWFGFILTGSGAWDGFPIGQNI